MSSIQIQKEIDKWVQEVNPKASSFTIFQHMTEELSELDAAIHGAGNIPEEAADVALLLLNLAEKNGFDLMQEVEKKFEICKKRDWKKPNVKGVVKHKKAPIITWRPKRAQKYYEVYLTVRERYFWDQPIKNENCFKTEKEARAMVKKLEKGLNKLILHGIEWFKFVVK